ncbi:MAG: hypothetical protein K5873_05835 [Treponema sp.]|nr:hypothetical protein [Treponema sp.]
MKRRAFSIRIEYILLVIAVLNFSVTEFCRQKAINKFFELDAFFEMEANNVSDYPLERGETIYNKVSPDFATLLHPYFYFNPSLAKDYISPSSLKNEIHIEQWKIASGFDKLLLFSLFLSFIALSSIAYRQFLQRAELKRMKAVSDAHAKFSRDLHDTVAQDLAVIKIYQEKGVYDKSLFYTERAFSQTRFLIDALHLNLSQPIEKLIRESVFAFEVNSKIQTEFFFASSILQNLKNEEQLELLFVLQEALSNIARHSGASRASIKITDIADEVNIKISDNGRGFNHESLNDKKRSHYGIANMKERVTSLGGSFEMKNKGGCSIAIRIKEKK